MIFLSSLTTIPNFKDTDGNPTLLKVKSLDKLKAEDFGKKKLEININNTNSNPGKQLDGMNSPRNAFNLDSGENQERGSNPERD